MQKIALATLVCLCVLTVAAFAVFAKDKPAKLGQEGRAPWQKAKVEYEWDSKTWAKREQGKRAHQHPAVPKRIARAVYFSADTIGEGMFDEIVKLAEDDVAFGGMSVKKDGKIVGTWYILYGNEGPVTELANVLETIAQGAPEKQKPQ